jgi:uncharacterized membrane protein YfcA
MLHSLVFCSAAALRLALRFVVMTLAVQLTRVAVVMSLSSIFFAKVGAKFASKASEKLLRRLLGCFMLVSVPLVVSKTAWWKEIAAQHEPTSEQTPAKQSRAAAIAAAASAWTTRFRNRLKSGGETVSSAIPPFAAARRYAADAKARFLAASTEFCLAVQSSLQTGFPQAFASAAALCRAAGIYKALSHPDALRDACGLLVIGAAGGLLSGLLGVGGGIVITPCLAAFSAMPHLTILGTTMLTMVPATISGTLQHHAARSILWPQAAALSAGSVLGATAGSQVALVVSEDSLRFVFAAMMCLFGARTLFR